MNQLNQELNITINPEDLKMNDMDLYLKLHDEVESRYDFPFNVVQEEVTRAINIQKGRRICSCCDGMGMVNNFKCIGGCFGRGYIG